MTTKYTSYEVHTTMVFDIYQNRYISQCIKPLTKHSITLWVVWAYRGGTPGNYHIRIYLADANEKPTGAVLASGDISANAWTTNTAGLRYEIPLGTPGTLQAGIKYCVVSYCDGASSSNKVTVRGTTSGDGYPDGKFYFSTNGGSSWTEYANVDQYFEDWGIPIIDPPTVNANTADGILYDQATLHGALTSDGGEACAVRFNYGLNESYGTDTDWQNGKVTGNTFEQLISSLQPKKTYHFRAEAHNSGGTSYSADVEFTTPAAPLPEGKSVKALITHPALKRVVVLFYAQVVADYDQLSSLDEKRIESSISIPVPTPCDIEVTTLADQTFSFHIPLKT